MIEGRRLNDQLKTAALLPDSQLDPSLHWLANYQAELVYLDGKTRLGRTDSFGPLRVQRPFYPEGDVCAHLYLLHPPGGLVAGDYLTIGFHLGPKAQALVTTPSAGKIYNNITDRKQYQKVHLTVADEAVMEWLPQETIVFDGANGELVTEVELEQNGTFVGWDIVCMGRPSSEDWFERGSVRQLLSIKRQGKLIHIENNLIDANSGIMNVRAGLAGQPVFGSFMITCDALTELTEEQRDFLQEMAKGALVSVTVKPGITVVRYLGACSETAKKVFTQYWAWVREEVNQRGACPPRIWNT
ncbi:urease accessory protein UreD [Litoribrevibacter albus]|uniref:urease accessory protein UreD n=1 Tax=Litoribrevibacter albus TaxID=1473156 RepID=UPI0024E0EBE0|nr:urease accessory protein UreD [Litoribrevibacter albus]